MWKEILKSPDRKHFTKDGKEWKGKTHKMPNGNLMTEDPHKEEIKSLLFLLARTKEINIYLFLPKEHIGIYQIILFWEIEQEVNKEGLW